MVLNNVCFLTLPDFLTEHRRKALSQTPQICTQCGTYIEPEVRFCSSCGAMAPQPVAPTVAAAFPQSNPAYSASSPSPNNLPYPMPPSSLEQTTLPNSPYAVPSGIPQMEYASPPSGPSSPSYPNYNSTPAAPVPPPPPPSTTPDNPYSSMPYYPPSQPVQKRSLLLPILIAVVVSIVIGGSGAGIYFLTKGASSNHYRPNGGGSNSSSFASSDSNNGNMGNDSPSQALNLTVTYAGDQITFTQIQQASKFSDDQETTYTFTGHKNWVRLIFTEKATDSSYFSYTASFHLILPNGNIIAATNAQQYSGPQQGVQRQNWVDFGTDSTVDLSHLQLNLGTSDEATMKFPLKDNADLSAYQPKQANPNTQFQYDNVNWTIKSITKSLYSGGKQAKAGQIYLIFDLLANNTSSDDALPPIDFLRLKAGPSSVQAPDYSSNLDKFVVISANSTAKGTAIFLITPTPDGKYTLDCQPNSNNGIAEKTVDIQIS